MVHATGNAMDVLQLFGSLAVAAMLVCYALEDRSHWFILGFAGACALGSAFLQGAWQCDIRAVCVRLRNVDLVVVVVYGVILR